MTVDKLKKRFNGRKLISRKELQSFFLGEDPKMNESTFRWRIHNLKEKNILTAVSSNLYSLEKKPYFCPSPSNYEMEIFLLVKKEFPGMKLCVWSTNIIHEFMLNIPAKSHTMLQVEKGGLELVFSFLQNAGYRNLLLNPDEKELRLYLPADESAIIAEVLITKSPVQVSGSITTVTIEKLVVDIFSGGDIYSPFRGNEFKTIMENADRKYAVNYSKLIQYAQRRGAGQEIISYLRDEISINQELLK